MNFKDILKLSRPRFWLYTAGTYMLGYLIGASSIYALTRPEFIFMFLIFLIPANLFIYGVNDYFDEDTDKYNSKKKSKEYLLKKEHKKNLIWIILISLFLMILSILLIKPQAWYLLLVFLFLSYYYSAPPLRFKARPYIDASSNFLYIMPGIIGAVQSNTKISWILLIGLFCWTAAMQLYSAIPDISADKKAKLKTTAVVLKENKSLIVCFILWAIFSLTVFIHNFFLGLISTIYPLLILLILIFKWDLEKTYWYYPFVNALAGFITFMYLAFII